MNKKFSTLVATLLLSGALFTLNATETPVSDLSSYKDKIEVVDKTETSPKTIKFVADVTLEEGQYIVVADENAVVDGNGKTLTGNLLITAEGVTVKNLTIVHRGGPTTVTKTAISVFASSVTITGNTIDCQPSQPDTYLTNGIILFPTESTVEYNVSGNTIKNAGNNVSTWTSFGIKVAENGTPSGTPVEGFTESATLEDFDVTTISNNTYVNCGADYLYKNDGNGEPDAKLLKAAQVTPIVGEDGSSITNAGYVKDMVENSDNGAGMYFNGTVEQFKTATTDLENDGNVAIQAKDGIAVSGVSYLPAESVKSNDITYDLVREPKADEYYLLVVNTNVPYAIWWNKESKQAQASEVSTITTENLNGNNCLWKMVQTLDSDGQYTFVFENKDGQKLEVAHGEDNNDPLYIHRSAGNAPYDNGVYLPLNSDPLANAETYQPFGLYKVASHTLTAGDLNALQNGGFYVSFTETEGTDAFGGLLTAVGAEDAREFKLKNEEGQYIIATAKNVQGENANQYVYAFELTDDATKANKFQFFHTPSSMNDDHLMIDKIDSIQVQLKDKDKKDAWATLGTYKLTTDGTVTLGASIETELKPVSIALNNNVVEPKDFLQNGFAVIKELNKEGDLFVVATGCGDKNVTLAEAVANDLEKQWAISYDPETKEYKMVNRENVKATKTVKYTMLRENGDDKDNIYVYGGKEYEITFVPVDNSDEYYKYLSEGVGAEGKADLAEKSFVMSYFSTVFNGSANVGINDKDWAYIGTEAEQAEFTAAAVDTVRAKSLINYWDVANKKWAKNEPELKAPVYEFTVGEEAFGLDVNGKMALVDDATPMAIRVAGEHFNLARVALEEGKAALWNGKVYAGNNDSYMYAVNCLYDENKNTMFDVNDNNRPEYRRLGKTVKDGLNDVEGDLNILKFFRTNDANQFLYENTMNRNANNGAASLNFLGETNLNDKPANAQLPFLVDTAFIRNNTRKPLYLLSVRNEFKEGAEAVPCPDHGFDPNCPHWTAAIADHRAGAYLVALDDSTATDDREVYEQAKYQGNVRLAFVDAKHVGDSLIITSSEFTGDKKLAKRDTLSFVDKDGKQQMNAATFAFKLVDRAVDAEGDKAAFIIEAVKLEDGKARYVRVHNTVPVLVNNIDEAATFEVMAAAEGEEATANESIGEAGVKVVATEGAVIVKGAEGKNVVITNVLGQQVANTVVSSSEATIAAPAGVVVVAVEGEAAVKAIVK